MRSTLRFYIQFLIFILLSLAFYLNGENISGGTGIYKLDYAKALQRKGMFATIDNEYLYQDDEKVDNDSLLSTIWNRLNVRYGFNQNFDVQFILPYGTYLRDGVRMNGFGDSYFALKFNKGYWDNTLNFALKTGFSVPTGSREISDVLYKDFTLFKKGYDLAALFDYYADTFSIHGNLGYFTRDNFEVLPNVEYMNFNYRVGLVYKLIDRFNWNLWLKWEFYTEHSIDKDLADIAGSQYLGLQSDIGGNFSFSAGYTKELYSSKLVGYRFGLDYSLKGIKAVKPKRIFDRYGIPLKIGVVEFDNENYRKTELNLSTELESFLNRVNEYKVTSYNKTEKTPLTDQDKKQLIAQMQRRRGTVAIYGEILSTDFVKDNYFKVPIIVRKPRYSYEIKSRIIVVDVATNTIVYNKIVTGKGSIEDGFRFFDILDKEDVWMPNASQELEMKRRAREDFSRNLIEELSGNRIM